MEKDVYDEMMAFIAMQDKEWEIHCRELVENVMYIRRRDGSTGGKKLVIV